MVRILKTQPKSLIIVATELEIPKELSDLITVLDFTLPNSTEIKNELLKQNRCFQIQSKEYLLTQNTVTSNMKLTIKMIKKRCNLEKQDIIYY